MRFDDHFLEELKTRLRPSEVIGRSVKLRKNGREWVGLSPFSKEKTPSFYVNDEKGFYHDFSSGKHGDIISFLQETERLSFMEAVEKLALHAGMALPVQTPQAAALEVKKQSLTDWMELAQLWFSARLQDKNPHAQAARDYLKKRGLSAEDIHHFGLGYSPKDRTALKDALVQKGAKVADLVECGLLIQLDKDEGGGRPMSSSSEAVGRTYDRFRDRLMFPIEDQRSKVVSFGGRALNPDEKAKYLNGPETPLFHKGQMLYGLPKALKIMGANQAKDYSTDLVVVEGYMDVIACQRANVAAVAPLGTALTEEQIDILWRRHNEPTLCFDGDKAGMRAASRALDRALPKLKPGRSFKVCYLPGGQDPDDMLREKGALALREALTVTQPFVEVLFRREAELEPLDTPEKKAGLKKRLRALSAQIEDKDLADSYRQDLLARLDALLAPKREAATVRTPWQPRAPFRKGGKYIEPPIQATQEGRAAADKLSRSLDPMASALAQAIIEHPEWLPDVVETLEAYGFGDDELETLAKTLVSLSFMHDMGEGGLDRAALNRHLQKSGLGACLREVQTAAFRSGAPFLAPDISLAHAHARWLRTLNAQARLTALDREFKAGSGDLLTKVGTETYMRLKTERDALRRSLMSGHIWTDNVEKPS